jgi:hypothetical protein
MASSVEFDEQKASIMKINLCERCARMREIISGKGSRFLLCEHSRTDPTFPKYPRQPVLRCEAFVKIEPAEYRVDPHSGTDPSA